MPTKFDWKNVQAADFIEAYNDTCSDNGFFPDAMAFTLKFKPEYAASLDELGFSKNDSPNGEPCYSFVNWDDELQYETDDQGFVRMSFMFLDFRGEETEEFIRSYFDKDMLIEIEAHELE